MELNIVNNDCNNLIINTTTDLQDNKVITFRNCELDEVELDLADMFEIILKDGKYYAVRRKPQYPKTYVECCEILDILGNINIEGYKKELLLSLQKLLICRDAYWKIAGEELGLDKPWEPDWMDSDFKYCLKKMGYNIGKLNEKVISCILAFPTPEMRDAFYENFKDLIEQCKELL